MNWITASTLALSGALPILWTGGEIAPPPGPDADGLASVPSGEVIVTEFMKDPNAVSDTRGEWIEVYNTQPWRANLEGWALTDDAGAVHVITNGGLGVFMPPGGRLVLGRSLDPVETGGVHVDYVFTGFSLGNGADQIMLRKPNGRLSDRVAYDDGVLWPDQPGKSISLDAGILDAQLNDDPLNWCHATSAISGGSADTGTPGAANDVCP